MKLYRAPRLQPSCVGALGRRRRKELEHLCRYTTRPAIANERLKRNRAGDVVLVRTYLCQAFVLTYWHRLLECAAMPRKPMVEYSGAFYHVITRGNQRTK